MANGTIAFDTLSTSDAKRSGTTKSVDTSYVYNGVLKLWINGTLLSGANTINESLNVGSVTDNGTGDLQLNFTSSFANVNYVAMAAGTYGNKTMDTDLGGDSTENGTGLLDCNQYNNDPAAGSLARVDVPYNYGLVGDLA